MKENKTRYIFVGALFLFAFILVIFFIQNKKEGLITSTLTSTPTPTSNLLYRNSLVSPTTTPSTPNLQQHPELQKAYNKITNVYDSITDPVFKKQFAGYLIAIIKRSGMYTFETYNRDERDSESLVKLHPKLAEAYIPITSTYMSIKDEKSKIAFGPNLIDIIKQSSMFTEESNMVLQQMDYNQDKIVKRHHPLLDEAYKHVELVYNRFDELFPDSTYKNYFASDLITAIKESPMYKDNSYNESNIAGATLSQFM